MKFQNTVSNLWLYFHKSITVKYCLPKQIKDVGVIKPITAVWRTGPLVNLIELIEFSREGSIFNMAICVHDFIYCVCETVFSLPALSARIQTDPDGLPMKLLAFLFIYLFIFSKVHYNIVWKAIRNINPHRCKRWCVSYLHYK